jgi:hypothetical protein
MNQVAAHLSPPHTVLDLDADSKAPQFEKMGVLFERNAGL